MKAGEFKRKAIRLPKESYEGRRLLSVTVCCENKKVVFDSERTVKYHLDILNELLQKNRAEIWAYCFMPNHVHFLIEADSGTAVLQLIKLYKQMTGFSYKKQTGQTLWQKSWFDHTLRRGEDIKKVVHYIFENPVRKGLVEDFRKYPFLGSGVETMREYLQQS